MISLISSVDAIKKCLNKQGILVDVRSPEEYRLGHLPMAENVPLDRILEGNHSFPKEMELYFYCDTGASSMLAAREMDKVGRKVHSMAGGLREYRGYLEKEEKELWTMVWKE
ncbi:MAG: rhodanese-like domain-containing protein [Eubacteriales bacterium]|nr:rhodanese-like domain-containing protein [Eubacteriales bacterium]